MRARGRAGVIVDDLNLDLDIDLDLELVNREQRMKGDDSDFLVHSPFPVLCSPVCLHVGLTEMPPAKPRAEPTKSHAVVWAVPCAGGPRLKSTPSRGTP